MRFGPSGKKFDEQWREIPDDTPIEIPVRMRQPKSMQDMVSMYVHQAMKLQERMSAEAEAVDEAEDLAEEGEEGDEILTPYELHDMAAEVERDARRREWLKRNTRSQNHDKVRGGVQLDGDGGKVRQGDGEGKPGAERVQREEQSVRPDGGQVSPGREGSGVLDKAPVQK